MNNVIVNLSYGNHVDSVKWLLSGVNGIIFSRSSDLNEDAVKQVKKDKDSAGLRKVRDCVSCVISEVVQHYPACSLTSQLFLQSFQMCVDALKNIIEC